MKKLLTTTLIATSCMFVTACANEGEGPVAFYQDRSGNVRVVEKEGAVLDLGCECKPKTTYHRIGTRSNRGNTIIPMPGERYEEYKCEDRYNYGDYIVSGHDHDTGVFNDAHEHNHSGSSSHHHHKHGTNHHADGHKHSSHY